MPLREELVRSSRTELLLVFGAVFGLLLLVCANVASLAIARRAARARETAIRFALGAGGARIVREHLAESALCAVLTALYRTDELRGHLKRALDNGVTEKELKGMITHLAFYAGWPCAVNAGRVAIDVFDDD